jgi:tetratricopeptide (TPR) repeat protein
MHVLYWEEMDSLIRSGRSAEVRQRLKQDLPPAKVSRLAREERVTLASLYRRMGAFQEGLRLLHPLVRSEAARKLSVPASPAECAEYAACLGQLGGYSEALALLDGIDPTAYAPAYFFRALVRISAWDYPRAAEDLERLLSNGRLTDYQRTLGRINLILCLTALERTREAERLVNEMLPQMRREETRLLHGTLLNARAQNALTRRDWPRAARALGEARELVSGIASQEDLFLRKWTAVLRLMREGWSRAGARELAVVRREAVTRAHWETVRDCDYQRAVLAPDPELARHVYFGTRYEWYRERLRRQLRGVEALGVGSVFRWRVAGERRGATRVLDLTGAADDARGPKAGFLLQRLLQVLAADFYRPLRLPELYGLLCPGHHFNPVSSALVVRQLLHRLRAWLEENNIHLCIDAERGTFRLRASGAVTLLVPVVSVGIASPEPATAREARLARDLARLRRVLRATSFCHADAAAVISGSRRRLNELLKYALERGAVERSGSGRGTCYRWRENPS